MEKSIESLLGATFQGHLTPPEGPKCRVTYTFSKTLLQSIPAVVDKHRREIGWRCSSAVCAVQASCHLPALDIVNEEVIVSIDPPSAGGTRQMLLQSLKKPELGLTLLVLDADGQELVGGDESWSPGDAAVIRASRIASGESPTSRNEPEKPPGGYPSEATKAAAAASAKAAAQAAKPEAPLQPKAGPGKTAAAPAKVVAAPGLVKPAAVLRPSFGKVADSVDDESVYRDVLPGLYECSVGEEQRGAWRCQAEGAHAPVDGGVGRSVMGAAAESRHAPSRVSVMDASLLQEPNASASSGGGSDADILTAKADIAERLVSAAAAGELGDLKMLAARSNVNTAGSTSFGSRQPGLTPLVAAAQKGRTEAVALLIEQGADLNAADSEGWTAVMHATYKQRTEVLKLLLQAHASPAVIGADDGMTPLHLAAMGARVELAVALLSVPLPASAREAKNELGRTALHLAAKNGRNATLKAILKAKGRIDALDNEGRTPFLLAASSGMCESLRILIEARADLNGKDRDGLSAERLAVLSQHQDAYEVLVQAAAR